MMRWMTFLHLILFDVALPSCWDGLGLSVVVGLRNVEARLGQSVVFVALRNVEVRLEQLNAFVAYRNVPLLLGQLKSCCISCYPTTLQTIESFFLHIAMSQTIPDNLRFSISFHYHRDIIPLLLENPPHILNEPERSFIHARLKHSSDATLNEPFTWTGVRSALLDYKCWLYGLAFHTMSLPLYTLSLFLPTIIKTLGYSAANAQLLTVPPYAVATILTIIVAVLSEKTHKRSPFILASTSLAIIGYILLLSAPVKKPGLSYAGTILAAAGIYPSTAIVLSWAAANVSGQTKRATATAMTITVGNLGAVLGTQLYRPSTSPRWFLGHGFAIAYWIWRFLSST